MKKINETYLNEATGIQFDIEYKNGEKKVRITPVPNSYKDSDLGFIFNRSKPETIIKIGQTLLEIGNFCEELK
jgi:hypothetical protein